MTPEFLRETSRGPGLDQRHRYGQGGLLLRL